MSALTISFDLSGENLQSVVNETTNNWALIDSKALDKSPSYSSAGSK